MAICNSSSSRMTFPGLEDNIDDRYLSALVCGTPFRQVLFSSAHLLSDQRSKRHDETNSLSPQLISSTTESHQDAFSGEIQHLFRSPIVNLTSGFGYFNVNGAEDIHLELDFPSPAGPTTVQRPSTTRCQSRQCLRVFHINLLKNVTVHSWRQW